MKLPAPIAAIAAIAALAGAACFAQAPGPAGVPPPLAAAATPSAVQPQPANRWTAAQVREAFQLADVNNDGQLSRAEAQRLAIMPRSFEDMDLNKDGLLTAAEYLDAFAAR